MAGRLPVIPMKGLAGKAGTPGEVGSTGSLIGAAVGTAAGIPLGPAGEIVLGLVGNLIGKAFDWGFRKKAKPAEPPPWAVLRWAEPRWVAEKILRSRTYSRR